VSKRRKAKVAESATPAPSRELWIAGGLSLLSFLIYLPALRFQILSWDDSWYITYNPLIRGMSGDNLVRIFSESYSANYLPLHLLSYAIDYSIWNGNSAFGLHLTSILINAFSCGLAFLLLRRLSGSLPVALGAATLFALHHAHIPAVAWISSRKGVLALFFALVSSLAYLNVHRDNSRTSWRWYSAALLLFICALLSKLSVTLLFAFFFAYDYLSIHGFTWPGRKPFQRLALLQLPFAAVAAVLAKINAAAQTTSGLQYDSSFAFLLVKGEAIWRYIAVLTGLQRGQPVYDQPTHAGAGMILPILALLLVPGLVYLAWRQRSKTGILASIWILGLLAPVLAFPLVTYMADRYLYDPSLGFCWLLSLGMWRLAKCRPKHFALLIMACASIFSLRFVQYLPVWKNSESLMRDASKYSDDFRVHEHLAGALYERKAYAEAAEVLLADAKAGRYEAMRLLGHCHYMRKDYAAAEPLYQRCIEYLRSGAGPQGDKLAQADQDRSGGDILNRYAHILIDGDPKRPQEAIDLIRPVIGQSQDAETHKMLGTAYYQTSRPADGIPTLVRALALGRSSGKDSSWLGHCSFVLGASFWLDNQRDRAREVWQQALRDDPSNQNVKQWLAK
jgi:protein O-mannosyl-transferase